MQHRCRQFLHNEIFRFGYLFKQYHFEIKNLVIFVVKCTFVLVIFLKIDGCIIINGKRKSKEVLSK